jgi:hypothetical protein
MRMCKRSRALCALQQLPAIGLVWATAVFTSKVDANRGDVLGDKFLLAVALDQARLASARLPHADYLPTTQCTPHQDPAGRMSRPLRVASGRHDAHDRNASRATGGGSKARMTPAEQLVGAPP